MEVDQSLAKALKTQGSANVVVIFKQDTSDVIKRDQQRTIRQPWTKDHILKAGLEQLASTSQKNVVSLLNSKDAKFTSFWINKSGRLLSSPRANSYIDEPIPASSQINAEWGIEKIEADAAWTLPGGNNGQGIVVGVQRDGGIRMTTLPVPPMEMGHGTHTMEQLLVEERPSLNVVNSSLVQLTDGSNADCDQAPNLVSNSWGGGQGATFYNAVINAWRAANIVPIFAQGNAGPSCATANSPGDSSSVIGVGATTAADGIASFSSLGPAVGGGVKPDVSAPGQNVRSAWSTSDESYSTISGTSMAAPHVAGAAALLLSRDPSLSYDQVKNLLQNNADRDLQTADTCGGIPSDTFPNNVWIWKINARKALAAAISGF
ncbi:Serine protease AprX [Orchesella cincta]|uniref:Serine protease AprX n=1 Tax=Orchesella cincta TaxID=48709 RepID=A0A1D2MHH9_ORCCI|nr:Serine protease AprX [Orchesella cincta]